MPYEKNERVEVWSASKNQWTAATIEETYVSDCCVDTYHIAKGTLKVAYVDGSGCKYILPDQVTTSVRKISGVVQPAPSSAPHPTPLATPPLTTPSPPTPESGGYQIGPTMCKWNCGFPVQPGLTRAAKKYDTCCRKCAQLKGQGMHQEELHDENCNARKVHRRDIPADPLQSVKANMSKLLASENLETLINAAIDAAPIGDGPFDKEACRLILDQLRKQHQIECGVFGLDDGATVARSGLQKVIVESLKAYYNHWFSDVLKVSTESFVQKNSKPLTQVYELEEPPVGKGSFGTVYRVRHRISGEKRVAKMIQKISGADLNEHKKILQEIHTMAMLDHPNIIKVYEYFDDAGSVSQVMEPCNGGELQDRIDAVFVHKRSEFYGDRFIMSVMKQTLRAVAFMHSKSFTHKDLKPQNIMLVFKESSSLKVIDFGLAGLFRQDDMAKGIAGTLLYISPQVLQCKPQLKCDIWSMGVILYNLITGQMPFCGTWPPPEGKNERWWMEETKKIIQENPMQPIPADRKLAVSENCTSLLDKMLEKDVSRRLDAISCLKEPWFNIPDAQKKPTLGVGTVQCLECYSRLPQLKRIIFLVMAHQSAVPALEEFQEVFTYFDTSNEGMLRVEDLRVVLSQAITRPLIVDLIAHALDFDGNGKISWTEFLAGALCVKFCNATELIHAAFVHFDLDGKGKISAKDLEKGLFSSGNIENPVLSEGREKVSQIYDEVKQQFRDPDAITKEQFHEYIRGKLPIRSGHEFFAV